MSNCFCIDCGREINHVGRCNPCGRKVRDEVLKRQIKIAIEQLKEPFSVWVVDVSCDSFDNNTTELFYDKDDAMQRFEELLDNDIQTYPERIISKMSEDNEYIPQTTEEQNIENFRNGSIGKHNYYIQDREQVRWVTSIYEQEVQ